jgi:hypothetical protein
MKTQPINLWTNIEDGHPPDSASLILLLKDVNSENTIEIKGWCANEKYGVWTHHLPDNKEYKIIKWKIDETTTL